MARSADFYEARAEEALTAARQNDDSAQRMKYLDRAASYATLAERARDASNHEDDARNNRTGSH